ncbi:NERD domain-containing protein [Streptomyces sp. FXJ1.4098]|nr:NERD domain-containing protein [Streptomyces sp. FXJ1.4098]
MIPPILPENAAPGERLVFQRLASDPDAEDWTVLHSLDLAQHVRQVQGEADFVVIVPGRGIAVIEVKSHRNVAFTSRGWELGSQRPTSRSPFKQADEAQHSIRSYLMKQNIQLRDTLLIPGVWFTHVRANLPASPEWHPWQILDRDDFGHGAARSILRLLDQGRAHHSSIRKLPSALGPDRQKTNAILKALRPRVELAAGSADLRRERDAQLTAFLAEQYDALDAMDGNDRVLFTGPAGSGKTFLALEAARRDAARGKSGWLLCYNHALAQYLKDHSTGAPGLETSSLHAVLRTISGLDVPEGANDAFWKHDLVDAALERLLDGEHERDYLIVDEAQDLTAPGYLDALDLMVKGGLAGGRCLFFGDFERQALYGIGDGRQELTARVTNSTAYTLTANCRNLPRIGQAVADLAGMSPDTNGSDARTTESSPATTGTRTHASRVACSPKPSVIYATRAWSSTKSWSSALREPAPPPPHAPTPGCGGSWPRPDTPPHALASDTPLSMLSRGSKRRLSSSPTSTNPSSRTLSRSSTSG